MKEALKPTARGSFWPVCKCCGVGVESPADDGGGYKKLVFHTRGKLQTLC